MALLVAAILVGCGGDDGTSAADQELIDAIAADLTVGDPPDELELDVDCMAAAIVETLGGAAGLETTYGITAEGITGGADVNALELDAGTAADMTDNVWLCGDFRALILSGFAGAGVQEEQRNCVSDFIEEDLLKQVFTAQYMGAAGAELAAEAQTEFSRVSLDAIRECGLLG